MTFENGPRETMYPIIVTVNSSLPGQNGRLFLAAIFACIFKNEKFCISIRISVNFVPKSLIYK